MSVPRLRFPGFVGEWDAEKLTKKVTKVGSGVTPKGGAEVYQTFGVPLIRSQNVRGDALDLSDVAYISDEINHTMSGSAVQPNDVLLNITGASIGRSCVVPFDFGIGNVNQHVCIIRMAPDTDPNFLQTFLASDRGQKLILQSQSGSGREGLNFENIRAFKIAFPTLPEQKKIAKFLGVVDAKIAALRGRVLGLKRYKRGLMQALFNQSLRFTKPDGTAFPDWEEMRLGDLGKFTGGGTPDTENPAYWIGDIPWVSSSDIRECDLSGPQISRWITEQALKDSATKIVPANSILIVSRVGVGKLTVTLTDVCTSQDFTSFTPTSDNVRFLGYWMLSNVNTLLRLCQGTSIKGLTSEDLKAIFLHLPHPDEQAKIAAALSAMDAKIAAVQLQVDKMQDFKKGLLQQMFV